MIKIVEGDMGVFDFEGYFPSYEKTDFTARCKYCRMPLDPFYVYIINKLKEAGLIHENFKMVCCICSCVGNYDYKD